MTAQHQIQSSTLPPAQPTYVLRGHNAQIHSICFVRHNTRLLTGDADGWLVLWNLAIKRPVAVWRAHKGAILGLNTWAEDKIITHGRDSKLLVWRLPESDEPTFATTLPIEDDTTPRHEPWLLHSLPVNTINFCAFAKCAVRPSSPRHTQANESDQPEPIFVAYPGLLDGEIDVWTLPDQNRAYKIGTPKAFKPGMVMAVRVLYYGDKLTLIAGYESGYTCIWRVEQPDSEFKLVYSSRAHSQPILSLDMAITHKVYYTSAADATVACHSLETTKPPSSEPIKQLQTKHSGQQSLTVRCDEKIFATAGWDGRMRVYSVKTMRELAVLKWHKQGCYAIAFSDLIPAPIAQSDDKETQIATTHQTVEQRRNLKAQAIHWLAAGAKDGKVSLWEIY